MKLGSVQGFGARFTPESSIYLSHVKEEAEKSGRLDEYKLAKRTIAYNFPQGVIKKEKSYPQKEVLFSFNPNQAIQFSFKPTGSKTNELDSFVKLAQEIRKISL